jgi:biotin-dependent carboxylase-like uncharacterized protein
VLEVVDPGFGLALQDRGRPGLAHLGVPQSGALDAWGHAAALILAGAPPDAATAEVTMGGAVLLALETCAVALAGADLGAERDDGLALASGRVHRLPAGARLHFTGASASAAVHPVRGARAYLALAGGIEAALVLGSAATLEAAGLGGFGGRSARPGDRLVPNRRGDLGAVGHAWPDGTAPHPARSTGPVRFVRGPDTAHLPPGALEAFEATTWTVQPASNRMGLRLDGPPLASGEEILSHPVVPGSVQVPSGGLPLVLLADGPTLGGYPVIAGVARADLPRFGQLRPGDTVRFREVTPDEARIACAGQRAGLDHVASTLARDAVWHRLPGDARG